MVKEYEDIIQPPEQFRYANKPIPKPRTDRPLQMQNSRRPSKPEQFRDAYKPIPKPRTDRPLQMQNARRPPKPQRPSPPPPKKEPSSKIKELSRTLKGHAK